MSFVRTALTSVAVGLLVIAGTSTSASAAQRPQVLPKIGTCPTGYSSSFNSCKPGPGAKYAIVKQGSFCPGGYYTSWNYCVSYN